MRYSIEGLNCAHCAGKIEHEIIKRKGLGEATLNFATRTLNAPEGYESEIQAILDRLEPGTKLVALNAQQFGTIGADQASEWRKWFPPILSVTLLSGGLLIQRFAPGAVPDWLPQALYLLAYAIVGWRVLLRAGEKIVRGQMLDEHFLMSIASIGAFAIGEWPEAAAVMVFYAIGERLQDMAVGKSRRSISALMSVRPDIARVMRGDRETIVPPVDVAVGEVILVKPGERVPLDGTVSLGSSFLDTSPLTGEPVPRRVDVGDEVMAGTINQEGILQIVTTRIFGESSVARILKLVEEATERKAPAEQFITSFARYYTPAVVVAALLLAFVPPLLIPGAQLADWVYRALVLLVISCPCALVVSVPLTYFAGIGAASRQGILFKGANFMDSLAKATTVVFDKTGTLTKGKFAVTEIRPAQGVSATDLLHTAAMAEAYSNHPIAISVQAKIKDTSVLPALRDVREIPGHGIQASLLGEEILVGNERLLSNSGITVSPGSACPTVVHVARAGKYLGYLGLSDEIRSDAREAVVAMRCLGITRVIMLTGDRAEAAKLTSDALGLDGYFADLLPEDKVNTLADIGSSHTIFVGDGINDAPVIASAAVGVAMGGIGSDAAIEAADVVLIQPRPGKVAVALSLARNTRTIARQNIILSLGVKGIFLMLGALGLASVWGAVFADVGVTLLAVLNGLRALSGSKAQSGDRCIAPLVSAAGDD